MTSWKIRHYLCAPIAVGDEVVGTLNLGRRSAEHPFGPREASWANDICRQIATRLLDLAREPESAPAGARTTIEDLGRQCAERTHVRLHADALEARATPLGDDEAGALWDAVAARHLTPLDWFDKGDRTYVVLQAAEPPPRQRLTRREAQVVSRVAAGLGTKEVAFELGIAPSTVATALASARSRLGVRSRVKLVEMARRLGLGPDGRAGARGQLGARADAELAEDGRELVGDRPRRAAAQPRDVGVGQPGEHRERDLTLRRRQAVRRARPAREAEEEVLALADLERRRAQVGGAARAARRLPA
jgi:DNA-binding CsgD family transcriptional regulator